MASQSAFDRKKTVEDILEENTKKLDKFTLDSSKKDAELSRNIKNIHIALDNIKLYVKTALANKSPESSPTSQTPNLPPLTSSEDNTKKIIDSVDKTIGAWVPPLSAEQKEENNNNRSMLKRISSTIFGVKKNSEKNLQETKSGFLWNKNAAKNAWDKDSPFLGNLTTSIISGLGKSALFQNPFVKMMKYLLTPGGILLMYFIGKMFKKHIWDPYVNPVISFFNKDIKPILSTVFNWIKDTAWPALSALFPSFEEIKNKYNELKNVLTNPSSFLEKALKIFSFVDILLAPITNVLKDLWSNLLIQFAKLTNALPVPGSKDATISILSYASDVIDTMSDDYKKQSKIIFDQQEIVKKYAAAFDPDAALALFMKIKQGKELTPTELASSKSRDFVGAFGDTKSYEKDRESAYYKLYKKTAAEKLPNVIISEEGKYPFLHEEASKRFKLIGDERGKKVLEDLRKINYEKASASFIKTTLDNLVHNNKDILNSSDAIKNILDFLVPELKKNSLLTADVLQSTTDLAKKYGEAKNNIHIMQQKVESNTKSEKSMLTQRTDALYN